MGERGGVGFRRVSGRTDAPPVGIGPSATPRASAIPGRPGSDCGFPELFTNACTWDAVNMISSLALGPPRPAKRDAGKRHPDLAPAPLDIPIRLSPRSGGAGVWSGHRVKLVLDICGRQTLQLWRLLCPESRIIICSPVVHRRIAGRRRRVPYSPPTESGLSKESVDHIASSIAKQLGYEPGADLLPIVEQLGGSIRFQDVWEIADTSSGSIRIDGENDFEIVLATHTGPIRDRFTIAHEIGHYVLHYLWPRQNGHNLGPIEAKRYGTGRVEWEANWFAAGFLMPAEAFRLAYAQSNGNLNSLSDQFQVSMEAARIRTESLGLG